MKRWIERNLDAGVIFFPGLLIGILCSFLASISPSFAYEISNDEMPTGLYLTIHFSIFTTAATVGFYLLRTTIPNRKLLILIVSFAVVFRIILIPSTPIHENDFYRYQWDGKVANAGSNPFRYSPEDAAKAARFEALRAENQTLFDRIGHPSVSTVYPPVAQSIFQLSNGLFGDSLVGMKSIFVLFDIGVIFLVIGILKALDRPTFGVLFYAWNPLVLKEFSNSAHYDSVPIFFTMLAVFLAVRERSRISSAIALAAGTLSKFFSVLLLPILSVDSPFQKGMTARKFFGFSLPVLVFLVIVAGAFLPFLKWDNAGFEHVFSGLKTYNDRWQYNAGAFALIRDLVGFANAKLVVAGLLLLIASVLVLDPTKDKTHLVWKCFAMVGALFILSPTAFPWYFAWVLPFLCIFPRPRWILLGALLPINYLDFHSAESIPFAYGHWAGIYNLPLICWGTFLIAWVMECAASRGNMDRSENQ